MRFEYFNLLQLQGSRAWFVTSEPKQTEAVFQICTTLFIATLLFGMFILSNPNPNPNPDPNPNPNPNPKPNPNQACSSSSAAT